MAARNLIDILNPALMATACVGGQTDQLNTSFGELRLELGEGTELSGADWGEILRVREENNPAITNELMEVDGTFGSLGLEVRGDRSQTEANVDM